MVEAFRVWAEAQLTRIPGKGDLANAFRYELIARVKASPAVAIGPFRGWPADRMMQRRIDLSQRDRSRLFVA